MLTAILSIRTVDNRGARRRREDYWIVPMKRLFPPHTPAHPARAVIFMSGAGTNAAAILHFAAEAGRSFTAAALATDAPDSGNAHELGRKFGIPVAALDLKKFYREHGESSIRLDSPHRRELRQMWSERMYEMLAPFAPEFGILAGFVPLTNLTGRMPCLNVHPGDLTLKDASGRRLLAGLHILPVERAILAGFPTLRSSVILAQVYTGDGSAEMDTGPVLGVSAPVAIDLLGATLDELRALNAARVRGVPVADKLRDVAKYNVERLKTAGDHVVLPRTVEDFAEGRFHAEGERLGYLNDDGKLVSALTVEYHDDGKRVFLEHT